MVKFLLSVLLLLFAACASAQAGTVRVEGRIENVPAIHWAKLICAVDGRRWEDSVEVINGTFSFQCTLSEPTSGGLSFSYILPQPGEDGSPEGHYSVPVFLQKSKLGHRGL